MSTSRGSQVDSGTVLKLGKLTPRLVVACEEGKFAVFDVMGAGRPSLGQEVRWERHYPYELLAGGQKYAVAAPQLDLSLDAAWDIVV